MNAPTAKEQNLTIVLNGSRYQTAARNVASLLREINAPPKGAAVALNDRVVRRADYEATTLHDGDRLEVIRAVQGG